MNLTERQQAAIAHRGGSLIVSAAAGAGKTAVLVERVLSLLCDERDPCDVDELLIVTFTNAAAGELRSRLAQALGERLAERPDDRRLRRQLALLGSAQIGTVHSFCGRLLRQHFDRAGLAPDFRLADETVCEGLKEQAMRDALEELYAEGEPGFTELCGLLSDGRGDRRLEQAVRLLYERLRSHPDPARWLEYAPVLAAVDPELAHWCRAARAEAAQRVLGAGNALYDMILQMQGTDLEDAYGPNFHALGEFALRLHNALERSWDEAREVLADYQKGRLKPARCDDTVLIERAKQTRARFCACVDELRASFARSTDELRAESARLGPPTAALCRAVTRFTAHYDARKRARNCVDFSDLEHMALALLQEPDGTPSALAREVRGGLRELMVDEYQDTNEVQERLYRLLTPESGSSFFVGDVKQSIYRFRLAEPEIFLDRCRDAVDHPERQSRLDLSENFRSREEVLTLCNFIFSRLMQPSFGGVDYSEGHALAAGLPQEGSIPCELWVIGAGEDEEESAASREAIACADRIASLLQEAQVETPDGPRPARPEDVAILLSSFTQKAPFFSAALAQRGVPCAQGGGSFFGRLEVAVMTSFLRILDNPRQDVPLVAVLRSPLFLFTAEELARLRLRAPEGELYEALCAAREEDGRCRAFLERLDRLRALSADLPVTAVLRHIYDEHNAEAVFAALDDGARRVRALRRLLELAVRFEKGGSRTVAGFLRWLDRMALREDPGVGSAEGAGVRLMSIHRSKGLEFPFVFLPDLSKRFNADDTRAPVLMHPDLGVGFVIRDRALQSEYPSRLRMAIADRLRRESREEEVRKLYVAMTRARQQIFLFLSERDPERRLNTLALDCGEGPMSPAWLASRDNVRDWLLTALLSHPDAEALRELVPSWTQVDYSAADTLRCFVGVEPARDCMPLPSAPPFEDHSEAERLLALADARYPHLAAAGLPSKLTPTGARSLAPDGGELGGTPERPQAHVWRQDAVTPRARRQAALRGTALHTLLRCTDPAAVRTEADAQTLLDGLAARGILPPEQAALCTPQAALAFARSPLGQRAVRAQRVLREYEFSVLLDAADLLPDGPKGEQVLMNGAIDLLLFEDGRLSVVDFKSDRIRPGGERAKAEEHRLQLSVYARAAEEIFGLPVAERWVWFIETETGVPV